MENNGGKLKKQSLIMGILALFCFLYFLFGIQPVNFTLAIIYLASLIGMILFGSMAIFYLNKLQEIKRLNDYKKDQTKMKEAKTVTNLSNVEKHKEDVIYEIGILFDIDKLGGFYGYDAYKIFFENIDPKKMINCTIWDGDTTETLNGNARDYCIGVQSFELAKINYIKQQLSQCNSKGLLPLEKRFIEGNVTNYHPLVFSGKTDLTGNLIRTGEFLGSGWAKGTKWNII